MLVLTRKSAQKIQVGENITITVLRIKGGAVKLGIDAPREVRVLRSELPVMEMGAVPMVAEAATCEEVVTMAGDQVSESLLGDDSESPAPPVRRAAHAARHRNVPAVESNPAAHTSLRAMVAATRRKCVAV